MRRIAAARAVRSARTGHVRHACVLAATLVLVAAPAAAQGTIEDYRRALSLEERYGGLVTNVADNFVWQGNERVGFRRSVRGGHEFRVYDLTANTERPAFDHERLAAALGAVTGERYTAITLPFSSFTTVDGGAAITVATGGTRYRCTLSDYRCSSLGGAPRGGPGGGGGRGGGQQNDDIVRRSPDGRYEAFVRNYNIAIRP